MGRGRGNPAPSLSLSMMQAREGWRCPVMPADLGGRVLAGARLQPRPHRTVLRDRLTTYPRRLTIFADYGLQARISCSPAESCLREA